MLPLGEPLGYNFDPLEALRRWPADRPVVMLHSGRYDPRWSRYSLLAEPVGALIHTSGRSDWIGNPLPEPPIWTHNPFRDLEQVAAADGFGSASHAQASGDPLATESCAEASNAGGGASKGGSSGGGAFYVGYLGYDLARQVERLPTLAADDHGWPDLQFHRCRAGLLHDHADGTWHRVGDADAELPDLLEPSNPPAASGISSRYADAPPPGVTDFHGRAPIPAPDRTRRDHEAAVARALEYIAAGDIFQANLAHRFSAGFAGSTRDLFLALARVSPAWYGTYLELLAPPADGRNIFPPRRVLAGTSPELFLQLDADATVQTRPIKGTRPSDGDPDELLRSEKDAAELNMIIDLLRNDLGRVCDYASVRVTQPRTIESHPTVHHGVATVRGTLHRDRGLSHLLRATFPGGSVTGAPKIRAMQIIEQLEPVRRGPYCGAAGLIAFTDGRPTARLSLTIRTLLIDRAAGRVQFSVGGGIVAESDPAAEYQETLDKAAALQAALCAATPDESPCRAT